MDNKKALIAMSGGVDSSVAACLMVQQGYDCIGATMKLYDNDDIAFETAEQTCCTLSDIEDARSVAMRLEFPYYVFNFKSDFGEKVIDNFVDCYLCGKTPNPCIECNRNLKFKKLMQRAMELGIDYVVTGHYVKREFDENTGRYILKKAADDSKDQSYVLYSLTQDELKHTLFPLGELTKPEIREIAKNQGFLNANKKESQDICFVPDGDYASFIEKRLGKPAKKGNFVDKNGKILGEHQGIIRYTIGQRKGLGIALGKPAFVTEIRPETDEVVLGEPEDLLKTKLVADNINLISVEHLYEPTKLKAKIRYSKKEQPAVAFEKDGKLFVEFDEPQRAITKGQAVVLYDGDLVVGGGTIIDYE
ncbi:MAG: tRNA 2-thiouridine(34) synthase MnmA [Acutalibacteraceae bacterium]|nr:tRNA 2-thiouridine(34) synthase MnmA [Acutalibacteraceae bacterium]